MWFAKTKVSLLLSIYKIANSLNNIQALQKEINKLNFQSFQRFTTFGKVLTYKSGFMQAMAKGFTL